MLHAEEDDAFPAHEGNAAVAGAGNEFAELVIHNHNNTHTTHTNNITTTTNTTSTTNSSSRADEESSASLLQSQAQNDDLNDDIENQSSNPTKSAPGTSGNILPQCCQVSFFRQYFDVDTADVISRLKAAANPLTKLSEDGVVDNGKPDLYGLVWVSTTLVFLIGVAGNFANYLSFRQSGLVWTYDFTRITVGASLIYGYVLLVPLCLWLFLWYRDVPCPPLTTLWCNYGYAMVTFVPAAILCTIPSWWLRWAVVVIATAVSAACITKVLWSRTPSMAAQSRKIAATTLCVCLALHLGVGLMFEVYFFHY